ncbi:hypothetical protein Mapa_007983 [Marchantia paleacea]|nr:hypothetical protein Mapa_014419 [Marchantia paleacea]KAG6550442.1 hypothetical protein Mapa_007983 [Marchantia paleacea]
MCQSVREQGPHGDCRSYRWTACHVQHHTCCCRQRRGDGQNQVNELGLIGHIYIFWYVRMLQKMSSVLEVFYCRRCPSVDMRMTGYFNFRSS